MHMALQRFAVSKRVKLPIFCETFLKLSAFWKELAEDCQHSVDQNDSWKTKFCMLCNNYGKSLLRLERAVTRS